MAKTYKLAQVVIGRGNKVSAKLTEDGVIIASISRPCCFSWKEDFTIKFNSDAAAQRFGAYTNCLSIDETLDILVENYKASKGQK